MKLHPERKINTSDAVPAAEPEVPVTRWSDLLRRDMSCWTSAFIRSWPLLILLPLLSGSLVGALRLLTAPKMYESSCSILRVEKNINRTEYAPLQRSEIKSLITKPSVLARAAEQLQAPYLRTLRVIGKSRISTEVTNERNSNLFEIKVRSLDPQRSAQIANAIGEAFVFSRQEAIRSELEQKLDASKKNLEQLTRELEELQAQLRDMESRRDERNKLDEARDQLRKLEKNYTDSNPRVVHQRLLVLELERKTPPTSADIKALEDKRSSKTIVKTNQEAYINRLTNSLLEPPDVDIQEYAQPSPVAISRKITLFTVGGVLLGLVLAVVIIIIRELLNFTVRSAADFTKALKLPLLGMIPEFTKVQRADFYASLQEAISTAEDALEGDASGHPLFIALAPYTAADQNGSLLNEFCEILSVRKNMKCRIIRSGTVDNGNSIAPYLVNDFIYGLSEDLPRQRGKRCWYFMLDDLAFISPPNEAQLRRLRDSINDCDVVFWELFDYESHRQLFSEIAQASDLTVIPARFGRTSKIPLAQMLRQMRSCRIKNIYGLLYDVSIKTYHRIVL